MLRGLARRAFGALPFSWRYEMFYQSGRSLGVKAYQATGECGPIIGSLSDQATIKPYMKTRRYSPELISLLTEFFKGKPDATFYDIGANIGFTTIPVAKLGVRCVSFEPEPGTFSNLRANIAVQNLRDLVMLRNIAVADHTGEIRFTLHEYNSGDHRIDRAGELSVPCIRLDDEPAPQRPFAVKIDTQGAEPLIFSGGETFLSQAGLIVSEFWPWGIARMGASPETIYDFISRHFTHGSILGGSFMSTSALVMMLKSIGNREYDSADFILSKTP